MEDLEGAKTDPTETLRLTVDVVSAYLSNNALEADKIPDFVRSVHSTLGTLGSGNDEIQQTNQKPAVPVKRSITPDYLICLEDGKKLKMLKRYLRSQYGLSPEEYRKKWGLPADYPMVAPNYAEKRSQFAKQIGLGRRPAKKAAKRGRGRR